MRSIVASSPLVARPWRAPRHPGLLPLVVVPVIAVVLSACATNTTYRQPYGVTRQAAVPAPIPRPKVEIEDDGKPVQAPPARVMRPDEDDPTQPWSPNYGRSRVEPQRRSADAILPPRPTHAPRSLPQEVHPAAHGALTPDEVIARAVAQHEMAAQQRR